MYSVTKSYDFEAAHQLVGHEGKCSRIHGHSYKVDVTISAIGLKDTPEGSDYRMVEDFGELNYAVRPLIARLDHHFIVPADDPLINDVLQSPEQSLRITQSLQPIGVKRTTAEELAKWFATSVKAYFESHIAEVEVTVWETSKSRATYRI